MKDLYNPQPDPELFVAGKTPDIVRRICSCGAVIIDPPHSDRTIVVPNGCAACQKRR
jgi:hypothetical protein